MVETLEMRTAKPRSRVASAFLVVLIGLVLFVAWGWLRDRELRDLTSLPPEARAGLYHRTLENLASVCAEGNAARHDAFCREQAEIALRFPECDAACERLARPILTNPAR